MECPICFTDSNLTTLVCSHHICIHCVEDWYPRNPSCPLCRKSLYFRGMYKKKLEWVNNRQYIIQDKVYSRLIDSLFEDYEFFIEEPEFIEELVELENRLNILCNFVWDDDDELYDAADMYDILPKGSRAVLYWDIFPHIVFLFVSKYPKLK